MPGCHMTEPPGTEAPGPSRGSPSPRAWLTRNLLVLSFVSFLQDAASELLYPILPIFITVVLGAPAAVLGSIEGLADGISAIISPFAGRAADRTGRKPLITAGYGLAALGKLLIALATAWPTVLVARCVDRFGKGLRGSPRDTLIVDGVVAVQRGQGVRLPSGDGHLRSSRRPAPRARRLRGIRSPDPPTVVGRRHSGRVECRTGVTRARPEARPRQCTVQGGSRHPSPRPDRPGHPGTAPIDVPTRGRHSHRLQPRQLPRRAAAASAALHRVLRGHDDPGVCDLQYCLRNLQLP